MDFRSVPESLQGCSRRFWVVLGDFRVFKRFEAYGDTGTLRGVSRGVRGVSWDFIGVSELQISVPEF